MKNFLLIFIFAVSLKADTVYQGNCISSFYIKQNGLSKSINMTYTATGSEISLAYSDGILTQLISNLDKFQYSIQALPTTIAKCSPIPKNNTLGLTNEEYNFMMALTGLLSSILLVSIIFRKV